MEKLEDCRNMLKRLTDSKHLVFTRRGNASIDIAVKTARYLGFTKILVPRDGSWLHYPIVGKKNKLEVIFLETVNGQIDMDELDKKCDSKTILIFHSHAGYFVKLDVKRIHDIAGNKGSFVIMDCSGALGLSYVHEGYSRLHSSEYCDILVSSLRKNKPVEADGGFVATNSKNTWDAIRESQKDANIELSDFEMDYQFLSDRLHILERRIKFLVEKTKRYSSELKGSGFDVLNDDDSLVIIVKFNDLKTKENIINYCEHNKLEFEICPREIRVLSDAISIEIKRLKEE